MSFYFSGLEVSSSCINTGSIVIIYFDLLEPLYCRAIRKAAHVVCNGENVITLVAMITIFQEKMTGEVDADHHFQIWIWHSIGFVVRGVMFLDRAFRVITNCHYAMTVMQRID